MGIFGSKKKKKEEVKEEEEDDEEEEKKEIPQDASLSTKIEMIQAELTKINGTLETLKEFRKSTGERFSTINEQIGEMRGMITDVQRTVGMIEVKATKAADLVESVQPDKLMIQVQKEDGKIEGLRGILEAKEEMIKNILEQLKKMREQMLVFRSVDQVIKLNEEVKDELMYVKKVVAEVERHADRVDNVFIEAQKSFEAFNSFADRLDDLKSELKDLTAKADKIEVATATFLKKSEFEAKIEKIEKSDKRVKQVLEEINAYTKKIDNMFKELETKLRAEFEFKIEKAEILSRAFESLLKENPLFANGLRIQEYMAKNIGTDAAKALEQPQKATAAEEAKPAETQKKEEEKK